MSAISAFDSSAEWVLRLTGGEARPDSPYVGHFSTESVLLPWGIPRDAELEMALVVPALAGKDWLNTVIVMGKDGTARGYARRTSFGSHSQGTAEILMMRGTARHRQSGWSLDLTIDIPPVREAGFGTAAPPSR